MNLYERLGSAIATTEAAALTARLAAWHDAMVAHERKLRTGRTADACDEDCPHAQARALWPEAVATLGARAQELTFLRSRASETGRRSQGGQSQPEALAQAADRARRTRTSAVYS